MEFTEKALQEMGFNSQDEFDVESRKITVKGYRLSKDEKDSLCFYIFMGMIENTQSGKEKMLLFERKTARELAEQEKQEKIFLKELKRLHGESANSIWDYGYDNACDILDGIEYMGAKAYAKYWFNTRC